jgi:hypothetical protein
MALEIVSPVPKKHTGKGTVLIMRETAIAALGEIKRNIDYRGKEGEGNHNQDGDSYQRHRSASHASEGSLMGCKVLLVRTAWQFWLDLRLLMGTGFR